jgi:hypothetical protein
MNEEWRIAAECAVQSGGNPVGFAGCTAVGERLLIDGARGLKIGFLAHVFDDIDRLLLRLFGSRGDLAISLLLAKVGHLSLMTNRVCAILTTSPT